jgi:chromosome segregation protein
MRLQKLEISGFKSFSDPAHLSFDRGVTAIVGPNGCGKSNVADAITWVLGEQSAKSLRGDRMEDVIFSGSDARKPTGTAEVRLLLADVASPTSPLKRGNGHEGGGSNGNGGLSDETEETLLDVRRAVELTRRLYRSGESEYLIDGEICRLRDIHDLLMDTGLGAKAYAIIEQGKIGMILSTRPTDRRQLIEEAAGVTKYKARRRAAELKLEAAQHNLTRIDDIVFEVEKQRGALKRQAAKARRYRRLRDELHRWEKVLLVRRYRDIGSSLDLIRDRQARARQDEALAASRLATAENERAAIRVALAEAESASTAAREASHACELDINRRQQQIEIGKQQIVMLDARLAELTTQLADLDGRQEPARQAIAGRREASLRAAEAREAAAAVMATADSELAAAQRGVEGLEGDVEAARGEVFAAINAATALSHAVEHAASEQERVGDTLSKLELEGAAVERELTAAQDEQASAGQALERARQALGRVRVERETSERERDGRRMEHEQVARALRLHEHELASWEARRHSLEDLQRARAGYSDAARLILAEANGRIGVQGSVADYIETDRRFERAVEACLGDLLQYVVVPDHRHAREGLDLVRDQRAGRCGFLVRGSSAVSRIATTLPACPGVRSLHSVIQVGGNELDMAIRAAIGEAWVAETLDDAVRASRETAAPVVTLDGDVLRGAHVLTTGGANEGLGLLATKGEIRELGDRLETGRKDLERMMMVRAGLEAAVSAAATAIESLTRREHDHEKEIVGLELRLARAAEDVLRLEGRRTVLATERGSAEEERLVLEARRIEAGASIARLETEQRAAEERLAGAQRSLFEAREGIDGLARQSAEARATLATLIERSAALGAEIQRLEEAASDLAARLSAATADRDETRRRREEIRAAVEHGERSMDQEIQALEDLKHAVRDRETRVAEIHGEVDRRELAISAARKEVDEIRLSLGELDVARATAESDLTHLASSCLESVQVTIETAVAEVEALEADGAAVPDATTLAAQDEEPSDDEDAPTEDTESAGDLPAAPVASAAEARARVLTAEEAVTELRARINRLGPVNMMAIEQFDELEGRHGFLTTQRRDLVESIASTGEAIKRIDETTKERFREAFAAINANFQETFGTLFGGGRAGIMLVDENDLLESGIEIIAQPPGKRLQNVQLLSGGEKALTAIALMFAIFKYKPSPFCLLDEIDAPLDDANIGRFVELLRRMQQETQFILITHNRKTMEIADRLYGVTMEEPGVSKLISVKLN